MTKIIIRRDSGSGNVYGMKRCCNYPDSLMSSIDSRTLRTLLGYFATGITVATVRMADGEAAGVTINSFTSVSLDPPLVLFCLNRTSRLLPVFRKAKYFSINILAADQEMLSRHFATSNASPLPRKFFVPDSLTSPILKGTLASLTCRHDKVYDGGDHMIILGEVVALRQSRSKTEPLLYYRGQYQQLNLKQRKNTKL